MLDVLKEAAEFALIVGSLYFGLGLLARRRNADWRSSFDRHRFIILFLLTLAVTAIKITEDVLDSETSPADKAILLFLHEHVPPACSGFFQAVTFTGSWRFLLPFVVGTTLYAMARRRRIEALILAVSWAGSVALVYVLKTAIGRPRPGLWETDSYWGSSFPSGHTLATSAVATALIFSMGRIHPRARSVLIPLAILWMLLVALSRLVLGVHWPTDVLTAACLGVLLSAAVQLCFSRRKTGVRESAP